VGNTDGSGLGYNANGYDSASPIYNGIMTEALKDQPAEPFPEPEGIKRVKVSKASGKLPGPSTPASMIVEDVFASFAVPTEEENLFYTVKIDKVSGLLATEYTPEDSIIEVTYQNYEPVADMLNWLQEIKDYYQKSSGEGEISGVMIGSPPTEYDNVHTAETAASKPSIKITSPTSLKEVPYGSLEVSVDVSAANGVEIVEYYLDDEKKFFTTTAPFTGFINISKFIKDGSRHLVVAKVIDALGYSDESAIEIKISDNASSENSDNSRNQQDSPAAPAVEIIQ